MNQSIQSGADEKIIILTDDANDLGVAKCAELGVKVLPIIVTLGEKSYYNEGEVTPSMIFDYVETSGKLPKTAARSAETIRDTYRDLTNQGYKILHICLSSGISATYNIALGQAEDFDNVEVVDSLALSTGIGVQIVYAANLIKEKMSFADIAARLKARTKKIQSGGIVDTVTYLHKGGRCTGLTMFIASVLKIHPQIIMPDGIMKPNKKYMGRMENCVRKYIVDTIKSNPNYDDTAAFITHSMAAPEVVAAALDELKTATASRPFKIVEVTVAGTSITCHCGRGTLGLFFYNN